MQTFQVSFDHLDLFSYIGGFSGAAGPHILGNRSLDPKADFQGALSDPATFAKRVHRLGFGVGPDGPVDMKAGIERANSALTEAKVITSFTNRPAQRTRGKPGAAI